MEDKLKALIILSQKGSQENYRQFLTDAASMIRSYYSHKKIPKIDMEELVQEFLLSVHRSLSTYDSQRPLIPWLFAIADHRMYDFYRSRSRTEENSSQLQEINGDSASQFNFLSALSRILTRIPETQKRAFTLVQLEGQTTQEAADQMKMSESNLRVTLHRAYQKIRILIRDGGIQ